MTLSRVVVTGYGLTSPIGSTSEEFWNNLHDGKIGIGPITKFDNSGIPVRNAGEIHDLPFDKYFVRKDRDRMDRYSLYAIYATLEALENAKLDTGTVDRDRTGAIVSSGIDGLQEMQEQIIRTHEKGIKRIQPMFILKVLSNMVAGNIALCIGVRGVCKPITTACASSNDIIGEASREIRSGYHDAILAGGAESTISEVGIGGFNALTILSTTEDPARSAIPSDEDRNGFVMGEGVGVPVLESLEHTQKRGVTVLAEVVGYGSNCDAHHRVAPTPDGSGATKAIKLTIKEVGIPPEDVNYVNVHGTFTQANEKGESKAIVTVLSKDVPVSSAKSLTGHLLGTVGAVEATAATEALRHNYIPMTTSTRELSEDIEANVVYGQGQEAELEYITSNIFGSNGRSAVLAFRRWET